MGIFKEEARYLEDMEKFQIPIYTDACDRGIFATEEVKAQMKETIQTLLDLTHSYIEWGTDNAGIQRVYNLLIIWEADGEMVYGTQYKVGYYKDRDAEFFSIDSKRVELTPEDMERRAELG